MCSAIASDDVAPGDGAFRTVVTGPTRPIRKSSTSDPSGSRACARTPARARTRSVSRGSPNVAPRFCRERRAQCGELDLVKPHAPVSPREPAEAPAAHGLENVTSAKVEPVIALPREGEDRVRADVDTAVDAACEVHAQEWVGGVGHGIHEPPNELLARLGQAVVLTAERNDRRARARRRSAGPACRQWRPAQTTSRSNENSSGPASHGRYGP